MKVRVGDLVKCPSTKSTGVVVDIRSQEGDTWRWQWPIILWSDPDGPFGPKSSYKEVNSLEVLGESR